MLSLRQIRYFLAVAETGNLSQASAGLFVAQPALSRQIALMEQELGFPLFIREARGVSLTPAGTLFRERIGDVAQAIDEAAEDARCMARGESGVLRLVHSSSIPIGGPLLASLQAFAEAASAARVDLDRVSSEVQVADIAAGRADIGVARMPVLRRDPAVRFVPLARERLVVAIPAAHPLADRQSLLLSDLAEVCFVSAVHRERGGLARRMTELCLQRGFVPRMGNVISRKTSMLSLVAAGFGIAVIPECMAALVPAGVQVRPLDDSDATADVAVLLPQAPSPLARRFAALCEERWRQALVPPG